MTEEQRLRFERYIASPDAQEWLADFADKAIRARSHTTIAALAILFADPIEEHFGEDFKAEAAYALEGISDRSIYAFLSIAALAHISRPILPDGTVNVRLGSSVVAKFEHPND